MPIRAARSVQLCAFYAVKGYIGAKSIIGINTIITNNARNCIIFNGDVMSVISLNSCVCSNDRVSGNVFTSINIMDVYTICSCYSIICYRC